MPMQWCYSQGYTMYMRLRRVWNCSYAGWRSLFSHLLGTKIGSKMLVSLFCSWRMDTCISIICIKLKMLGKYRIKMLENLHIYLHTYICNFILLINNLLYMTCNALCFALKMSEMIYNITLLMLSTKHIYSYVHSCMYVVFYIMILMGICCNFP